MPSLCPIRGGTVTPSAWGPTRSRLGTFCWLLRESQAMHEADPPSVQ